MSAIINDETYYYDASQKLDVAKFPEDFADWLRDENREQDAREFLVRWKHLEDVTPSEDLEFDDVLQIAQDYAVIEEINAELHDPVSKSYIQLFSLLRDLDRTDEVDYNDPVISWDREAAIVNQALVDTPIVPLNMDEHEFDHVSVYVEPGNNITDVMLKTVQSLLEAGHRSGARRFLFDLGAVLNRTLDPDELFALAWSYVDILPERGMYRNAW